MDVHLQKYAKMMIKSDQQHFQYRSVDSSFCTINSGQSLWTAESSSSCWIGNTVVATFKRIVRNLQDWQIVQPAPLPRFEHANLTICLNSMETIGHWNVLIFMWGILQNISHADVLQAYEERNSTTQRLRKATLFCQYVCTKKIILCQLASFVSAASREPAVAEKVLVKNLIHAAHPATTWYKMCISAYLASWFPLNVWMDYGAVKQ